MVPLLAALAAAVSLVGTPWGPGLSPRQLFDKLDPRASGAELTVGKLSEAPGEYAWSESYRQAGYVTMYEATGDTRYLDEFVSRFRELLSIRDDRKGRRDVLRGRAMPAWGCPGYTDGRYTCWNVHAGMLTAPAARFCRLVSERKALRSRYAGVAAEFKTAIEETVAAFDADWRDGPNADEGYYVEPALDGKHLPLNQQNALGRTLLDLAVAAHKPAYRARAARLAAFFKRRLRLRPDGSYDWSYWPNLEPPYGERSEDVSHAAINVDFAVGCCRDHVVFTRQDMARLCATFLKVVRKADGTFASTVGGSGSNDPRYLGQVGRWGCLGTFDRRVTAAIRELFYKHDPPFGGDTTLLALAYMARFGQR